MEANCTGGVHARGTVLKSDTIRTSIILAQIIQMFVSDASRCWLSFGSCFGMDRHVRVIHISGPDTTDVDPCEGMTCGLLDG